MIIFGTRSSSTKTDEQTKYNCTHCNSSNTVRAAKYFNYFHIFWIPILPYSSKIITECSHCKQVQFQKEIDKTEVQKIKSVLNVKIPFKYYSGLILIGLLFTLLFSSVIFSNSQKSNRLKSPEVGDIYKVRYKENGEKKYTLYKIDHIKNDTITFKISDYSVSKIRQIKELLQEENDSYSKISKKHKNELDKINIIEIIKNK